MTRRINSVIYYLLLFLLIFQSCKNTDNTTDPSNEVKVSISDKKIKLSDLVTETRIIPLETNEKCLIGNISKLLFYENKIFILDKFVSKGLLVFDEKGNFLYKVGKTGQGPGEYSTVTDFYIDETQTEIVLLANSNKLIFYDISGTYTGKTIDFLKNEGGAFDVIKTTTGYAVRAASREDDLKLLDDKLKVKNSFFPFLNRDIDGGIYPNALQKVGDNLALYFRYCSNIIYKIEEETIVLYKKIVFPEGNINYDDLTANSSLKEIENSYFLIENFISSLNHCFLAFKKRETYYLSLFNNKDTNVIAFKHSNFENDITFDPYIYIFGVDTENDYFIWSSSPERIKNTLEKNNINLEEGSIFKNLNTEANPVLLFTRIKI